MLIYEIMKKYRLNEDTAEKIVLDIAESIYREQLRILKCCGELIDGNVRMGTKYFMEMLVRPAFGDDDEKYDEICGIFDEIEKDEKEG